MYDEIRIGLASPAEIRSWSFGEVKTPETINYRTLKPEVGGLFDERIFGPSTDWSCLCGKYKQPRYQGIRCEKCKVEVTSSSVRRERMGHVELAAPVTHIWFLKGLPSRLGYLLGMPVSSLERVVYYESHMVLTVDKGAVEADAELLAEDLAVEIAEMEEDYDQDDPDEAARYRQECELLETAYRSLLEAEPGMLVHDQRVWQLMVELYDEYFTGGIGAEAVRDMLDALDVDALVKFLVEETKQKSKYRVQNALKRLRVAKPFTQPGAAKPSSMVLTVLPVIPPELRPMVQLEGGRFRTSDLNELYRRVINRNRRLDKLLKLGAPEIIVNNEKRMLQEAVDALLDNGKRSRPVADNYGRAFKSLADALKGKQGRFRKNLLGKRADYSARSVIVAGPDLELTECGLPKRMALELFKPFVLRRLVMSGLAPNLKTAKHLFVSATDQVWDCLSEVVEGHPVLLNRAPTLHRLSIQAFQPKLIEGKSIELHPLVCAAFNADFDGDQMAVHVPLSVEAQAEARLLLWSANNMLSPASGSSLMTPTQDMVVGLWYLSAPPDGSDPRLFSSLDEMWFAYDAKLIGLNSPVVSESLGLPESDAGKWELLCSSGVTELDQPVTTPGRVLIRQVFPEGFPHVSSQWDKSRLGAVIDHLIAVTPDRGVVAECLDGLKSLGFEYATRSGLTLGYKDLVEPTEKRSLLAAAEQKADNLRRMWERGLMTLEEQESQMIEVWSEATDQVTESLSSELSGPLEAMMVSGARGNLTQVRQLTGMRGLMMNPDGEVIPVPVRNSFREGLTVSEYFVSTHGARKGLVDTALRTETAGHLSRRLVDVAQASVTVLPDEAADGPDRGIPVLVKDAEGQVPGRTYQRLYGRVLAAGVGGYERGRLVDRDVYRRLLNNPDVVEVRVCSPLTDPTRGGLSTRSYGMDLASGGLVLPGEAVGVVAAQSIGEPGTQLTMRTFHTGGVASGEDLTTGGLPRVIELFEARVPAKPGRLASQSGEVLVDGSMVKVLDDSGTPVQRVRKGMYRLVVESGDRVKPGDRLTEGPLNPHELAELAGVLAAQMYLVEAIQQAYLSHGIQIHDKHVELVVARMCQKVEIMDPGDTEHLVAALVDRKTFFDSNRVTAAGGGKPATAKPKILSITNAAQAQSSWVSAASFQNTIQVVTDAVIRQRSDRLESPKENVVVGGLIPVGTGYVPFREAATDPKVSAADLLGG